MYSSLDYVRSLSHIGEPYYCENSQLYLIKRSIPGTNRYDLISPYPFLSCDDLIAFDKDIKSLDGYVSVTIVTDPFSSDDINFYKTIFPDYLKLFKYHSIVELASFSPSKHHLRNCKKGLSYYSVEITNDLLPDLEVWCDLYAHLKNKHGITGPSDFTRNSFYDLAQINQNLIVAKAIDESGVIRGMSIWLTDKHLAYYHLAAYDQIGYASRASYALFYSVLKYFLSQGIQYVGLGAGAGPIATNSGLNRFKKGWANQSMPVYICGKIIDHDFCNNYAPDAEKINSFFPPYRNL